MVPKVVTFQVERRAAQWPQGREYGGNQMADVERVSKRAGGRRGVRKEMGIMPPWAGPIYNIQVTSGTSFV